MATHYAIDGRFFITMPREIVSWLVYNLYALSKANFDLHEIDTDLMVIEEYDVQLIDQCLCFLFEITNGQNGLYRLKEIQNSIDFILEVTDPKETLDEPDWSGIPHCYY